MIFVTDMRYIEYNSRNQEWCDIFHVRSQLARLRSCRSNSGKYQYSCIHVLLQYIKLNIALTIY